MKPTIFILFATLSSINLYGQIRTMLIHKNSGDVLSIPIEKVDSVTYVQSESVQRNKWYFMLENPGIADYLRDFDYDTEDYSYHKIFDYRGEPYADKRQDWPYAAELPDTIIYNLIPNREYTIQQNGKEITFWTLGQLRMLRLEGVNNVRDLGGWRVPGGRHLRYGRIVRGPELNTTLPHSNPSAALHQATDNDLRILREEVNIKAELDLRSGEELPHTGSHSVLGDEIHYLNVSQCSPNPITQADPAWCLALRFIISCLSDEQPVYLHCRWGADRTGLLCMLIEGVLGVSESDLSKDFELTSFAGNTRYRTDARFRESIAYIKQLPGNSLKDKFRTYWLNCGVKEEELVLLSSLMTE